MEAEVDEAGEPSKRGDKRIACCNQPGTMTPSGSRVVRFVKLLLVIILSAKKDKREKNVSRFIQSY